MSVFSCRFIMVNRPRPVRPVIVVGWTRSCWCLASVWARCCRQWLSVTSFILLYKVLGCMMLLHCGLMMFLPVWRVVFVGVVVHLARCEDVWLRVRFWFGVLRGRFACVGLSVRS